MDHGWLPYPRPTAETVKVYVAGPMTYIPQFNIPAFDQAAGDLRDRGHEVISPAELDDPWVRERELASPDGAPQRDLFGPWGDFLARDVRQLANDGIEAIYVLPGWEKSKGARLETFVGYLCGLSIISYVTGTLVPVPELAAAWVGLNG